MTKWKCGGRKDNSEYSLVSSLGNWKNGGITNMSEETVTINSICDY